MKSAEDFLAELAISQGLPPEVTLTVTDECAGAEPLKQQIEARAVLLLAMREHGAKELKQKLLSKFVETDALLSQYNVSPGLVKHLIDEVVLICQQKDWQNDERYIEQAVRNWADKGSGPLKIRQKLQQACARDDLISAYLDWDDADWIALARETLLKKYDTTAKPKEPKEQAKRMRFLQSRGFAPHVIWKAFRAL